MSEALPDLKHSDVIYKGRVFNVTVDEVAYPDGRVVKMESCGIAAPSSCFR